MRWPFGPPHLTLKPSKKTNKNKQTKKNKKKNKKNKKNNIQPQNQEQSKQNRNKSNTKKEKQTEETRKHLNLPNPDEQHEPPQKNPPKNWEKQAFLTLLKQCQTHQKQTFNIKTLQKTNPKNTILPCSKTIHYFS